MSEMSEDGKIASLVEKLLKAQQDLLYCEYVRKKVAPRTLKEKINSILKRLEKAGVVIDRSSAGLDGLEG